ncbi:MAG: hypothetical protein ABW125_03835 [Candidatus Thiodiazotropha lotti]
MSNRLSNAGWIGLSALVFYFYYFEVAGYWNNKEGIDPLVVNFICVPALFGLITIIGLKGALIEKILWFCFMPVIPCLILGQEGDPAKHGLQWMLIMVMQIPYWVSGAFISFVITYVNRKSAPKK